MRRWQIVSVLGAAGALPVAVVGLLSAGPFATPILPELVPTPTRSDQAVQLLGELSKAMLTMSVGLAVAMTWLYRQPLRRRAAHLPATFMVSAQVIALTSIFAGLRFQYDMARQLSLSPLDFARLRNRLFWQGMALLLQLSVICMAAAAYHLLRDRRYRDAS